MIGRTLYRLHRLHRLYRVHRFRVLAAIAWVAAASAHAGVNSPPPLQFRDMGECKLESGQSIRDCRIGFRIFGHLNADKRNAVLFPSWFGGTSEDIAEKYVGPQAMVDSEKYFVIAVDTFGNGVSSSPSNSAPQADAAFPRVSIRDMVRMQQRLLREQFGLTHLHAVVGVSMGGMQALQWAVTDPDAMDKIVAIAASPRLATYDLVLWDTFTRVYEEAIACQCARPLAILSGTRFLMAGPDAQAAQTPAADKDNVRLQIARQAPVPNGMAYDRIVQLQAMIGHDISRGDDSLESAAKRVRAQVMIVAGRKDDIVTPGPVLSFAPWVHAEVIESPLCGHDIPRCDGERIQPAVRAFLAR
jgi:homoserine O-acetyltransferase